MIFNILEITVSQNSDFFKKEKQNTNKNRGIKASPLPIF